MLSRFSLSVILFAASRSVIASDDAQWIDTQRRIWDVPGVTVAVVQLGKRPRLYASGLCNIERKEPCSLDSPFHIASTTKFFTGLLAATLAAEGKLSLDEPLISAWPEFRLADDRWKEITLRDLLSQRSGLGSVEWPYFWDQSLTRQDYLARVASLPMAMPFRRWSYSNANHVIAGSYIERVTGQSWESLMQKRVFAPLGMKHSGFQIPANTTAGYGIDANGHDAVMPVTTTQAIGPAGTIVSTAQDLSHQLQVVLEEGRWQGRQALPPKAITVATSSAISIGYDRRFYGPPGGYGFGVFCASYHDQPVLFHGGGYAGYSVAFALLPQQHLGVVVLTNRNATLFPQALALGLLDRVQGMSGEGIMTKWLAAVEPPTTAADNQTMILPKRPLADYQGQYHNPAWGTFTIIQMRDQLKIRFGPFEAALDVDHDGFSFLSAPGWERIQLHFDEDGSGNITGFMLNDAVNAEDQKFDK